MKRHVLLWNKIYLYETRSISINRDLFPWIEYMYPVSFQYSVSASFRFGHIRLFIRLFTGLFMGLCIKFNLIFIFYIYSVSGRYRYNGSGVWYVHHYLMGLFTGLFMGLFTGLFMGLCIKFNWISMDLESDMYIIIW